MNSSHKCPNCGQYKYVSLRLYYMLAGFVIAGCGIWLLIIPPIGVLVTFFGVLSFLAGIFANGRICTHCKYKTVMT